MPANTTFVAGAILTAQQQNNLPWGIVQSTAGGTSSRAFKSITTTQTFTAGSGNVTITDSSITVTAVAGRLYKASIVCGAVASTSASGVGTLTCVDGSNNVQGTFYVNMTNSLAGGMATAHVIFDTGAGGSLVRAWRFNSFTGDTLISGATGPTFVSIEDIGPSS
jgi:hypothetical protein